MPASASAIQPMMSPLQVTSASDLALGPIAPGTAPGWPRLRPDLRVKRRSSRPPLLLGVCAATVVGGAVKVRRRPRTAAPPVAARRSAGAETAGAVAERPVSQRRTERQANVIIFSRPGCAYCVRAKSLLEARGVPFGVVDVLAEPERRAQAARLSGNCTTLPQVFVGQTHLGGYDDLERLDKEGQLFTVLAEDEGVLLDKEGAPISPTPAELLRGSRQLPPAVARALQHRSEALMELQRSRRLKAGSQPSVRAFVRYAVTSQPAQDQTGNVPLNAAAPTAPGGPALPATSATELADLLRRIMLQLLESFSDPIAAQVDYPRMRESEQWGLFLALTEELADPRLANGLVCMDLQERKAFLLNLYNIMTFHGVVAYGRRSDLWGLYCFYISPAVTYCVAGVMMSLDDVENGMLRAQPGYFQSPGDSLRRCLRVLDLDPRVHMALNCGAKGCPAVAVYTPDRLDAELEESTAAFLASDANLRIEAEQSGGVRITCSELFKMYSKDWAGDAKGKKEVAAAIARWLVRYTTGDSRRQLQAALDSAAKVRIKYFPYDWASNGPEVQLDGRIYNPRW